MTKCLHMKVHFAFYNNSLAQCLAFECNVYLQKIL